MALLIQFGMFRRSAGRKAASLVCLLALAGVGSVQAQPATEYEVKAVFLFNCTRFVEWPGKVEGGTKPLVIAVLGDDPFGRVLDDTVKGEQVNGRPLTIVRIRQIEDAETVQIDALFISRSEKPQLAKILKRMEHKPVLTVSDIPLFAESGGMVGLVTEGGKTKIQINVEVSKAASLAISSKLLRPAQIVTTRKTSQSKMLLHPGLLADFSNGVEARRRS